MFLPVLQGKGIMTKTLILYYSRTGTTDKLAMLLQQELDADIEPIRCGRYAGLWGYVRAAYDSLKRRLPDLETVNANLGDYDQLLVGGPIWTSYPATPLRAFLKANQSLPDRVGLFLTYGGHSPPEKAEADIQGLLPGPLEGSVFVSAGDLAQGLKLHQLSEFVRMFKR